MESRKARLVEPETRMVVPKVQGVGRGNEEMLVKGGTLMAIRSIDSRI